MSFLTKGMMIGRRDLISAVAFPALLVSWAGAYQGMVIFIYFEEVGASLSFRAPALLVFAFSCVLGGVLLDRVRRRKLFFLLFFVLGAVQLLPIFYKTANVALFHLFAIDVTIGLVYPAAYSFLADVTKIYERGRVAGLAWSGVGLPWIFLSLTALRSLDFYFALQGAFYLLAGLIGVFITQEKFRSEAVWKKVPMSSILSDKNFLLYAGAGGIISFFWTSNTVLVLTYASGIISNPGIIWGLVIPSVYVVSSFFIGFLADRWGRKPMIIFGSLLIASSFMFFVLFQEFQILLLTAISFGLGLACTWMPGSLVVFGDLARKESRGRYYGVGMGIIGVGGMGGSAAAVSMINASATIILMSTLFIAFMIIMPIIMARETLPPKEREEEIYDYISEIEKDTAKDKDNSQN